MKHYYNIIIPHKNTPTLLQRCLDSIPQRDDLHVIVVDDNSDPDLVDFEHFPGLGRDDVEVIFTKEGKGAGYARNVGLDHADCEKILFSDSDDYFNYCINDILDDYKEDDTDIVFFERLNVDSQYYTYSSKRDWYGNRFKEYEENPQLGELKFRYEFDGPVCKLIRKSLIDKYNIRFEEVIIADDVYFSYMTGHYAESIKADKRAIYTVTFSSKSAMFTWNPEKIKTRIAVNCRRVAFLKKNNVKTRSLYCLERLLPNIKKEDPGLFEECLAIISQHGLDAKYYRTYINNLIDKEEKEKKITERINTIRKIVTPLKNITKRAFHI